MNPPGHDPLLLAGRILTLLMQGALAIAGLGVCFAFAGVILLGEQIDVEMRAEFGPEVSDIPTAAVLALLALALAVVVCVFVFFGKLRGIISTVAGGDPFVPENADRLTAMAWLMLAVYLLIGVISAVATLVEEWAQQFDDIPVTGIFGFDLSSVLLIVTLFILARVFRHGAAMREDLEGTV